MSCCSTLSHIGTSTHRNRSRYHHHTIHQATVSHPHRPSSMYRWLSAKRTLRMCILRSSLTWYISLNNRLHWQCCDRRIIMVRPSYHRHIKLSMRRWLQERPNLGRNSFGSRSKSCIKMSIRHGSRCSHRHIIRLAPWIHHRIWNCTGHKLRGECTQSKCRSRYTLLQYKLTSIHRGQLGFHHHRFLSRPLNYHHIVWYTFHWLLVVNTHHIYN